MLPGQHARSHLLALWIGVLASLALVTGCAADEPAGPDITGVITSAESLGDSVSFRVIWTEDMGPLSEFSFDALQATAEGDLRVKDAAEQGDAPRTAAELEVGDIVSVVVDGPVAESYPPQARAGEITYLGRYDGELPEAPGLEPPSGP